MICTFYSHKCDVGHTLTIVNVAELLYRAGFKVLVIDWDLENPGIERYFSLLDVQQVSDRLGLMDMLLQYKEDMTRKPKGNNSPFELENPIKYLISVNTDSPTFGRLYLLTAGRRSTTYYAHYNQSILNFNWQEFYEVWGGELYFDWLRQQFEKITDVVLINSRDSFTKTGGACTYHLADVIIMFCEPNQQIIRNTYDMAKRFTAAEVQRLRLDRPLKVMIVPYGVDDGAEKGFLVELEQEFLHKFNEKNFAGDSGLIADGRDTWVLRIPQVPYYMFNETVVVRQPLEKRHIALYESYLRLTRYLAQQAPVDSQIRNFKAPSSSRNQIAPTEKHAEQAITNIAHKRDLELGLGDQVKPRSKVYLRKTPGYVKSVTEDMKSPFPQDYIFEVLDGPRKIDGLTWWCIGKPQLHLGTSNGNSNNGRKHKPTGVSDTSGYIKGWVAGQSPSGSYLLQKVDTNGHHLENVDSGSIFQRVEEEELSLIE